MGTLSYDIKNGSCEMAVPHLTVLYNYCCLTCIGKGKGKAENLYSALHGIQTNLKRSGMDHTVLPAINTMPAFYLVSVHQMAPPPIEVANI